MTLPLNIYIQEGYMDGRRVLKKAGPSLFGIRLKRDDREVWATGDGMEARRNGKRLWGTKLEK